MKHRLRLYDNHGDSLSVRIVELLVDGKVVDFDATDERILAIEEFAEDGERLRLSLEVSMGSEIGEGEQAELLIECSKTKMRQAVPLTHLDVSGAWQLELELPTDLVSGKIVLHPRVTRKTPLGFLEAARGRPVEIVLEPALPPGGQGFLEAKYGVFKDLGEVPEAFKRHLIYVQFRELSGSNPVVWLNEEFPNCRRILEGLPGRSDRARLSNLNKTWVRTYVAVTLAETAISLLSPHLGAVDSDEDLQACPEPHWVYRVVQGLANCAFAEGVLEHKPEDNWVSYALRAFTSSPAQRSNVAGLANLLWLRSSSLGDAMELAEGILR